MLPMFLGKLDQLREAYGKAIHVTSGSRCAAHNRAVGGSAGSQHLLGNAADLVVTRRDRDLLARFAEEVGLGGIGVGETFVHVDDGPRRRWTYETKAR